MARLSATTRRALGVVAVLAAAGAAVAASRSLRASFAAAYVAFRDPSRVHGDDDRPAVPPPPRAPLELDPPDLSSDFDRVTEADLGDAGALSTFVQPDLPIPITQRTLRFAAWFAGDPKGRQAFVDRFRRAGRYRATVEQALRDADLPEDLVWIAAILSGFEPTATSPRGAVGLFQFMPETAARYGLSRSEWVDERRSIPRSTAAAAAHLGELFARYGRWDLALAAYNTGVENLDAAIEKLKKRRGSRQAGKPIELSDLAEAHLVPRETANFVPQVQAFALVAANRGRFGLDDLDVPAPLEMADLVVPADTRLSLVARAAGVSLATLRDLNPDLLRDRTPPGTGDVIVEVPADKVAVAMASLPVLIAREQARLAASAAAEAGAAPSASAAPAAEAPSAVADAGPGERPAPAPPPDRWTLASGVVIERRPSPAADATLSARIEVLEMVRSTPRPAGAAFEVNAVHVRPADLAAGLSKLAEAVRRRAAGEAAEEARRRGGAARRQALAKAPYGSAWIALGDRLFGAGRPLGGAVLAAPAAPLQAVVIADAGGDSPAFRAPLLITVTASGAVDRAALAAAAERAFADVAGAAPPPAPLAREERIDLVAGVPSPRILFGWMAAAPSEGEQAALRLAILALAHEQHGRVARALVAETHVAVRVRGLLDAGSAATVVAIEASPSVLHDVGDVERELDRAVAGFAERGPTDAELASAKEQLRARLAAARGRAGSDGEPREAALARIARTSDLADRVTAEDLRAVVEKALSPGRRVVVTTRPRGSGEPGGPPAR